MRIFSSDDVPDPFVPACLSKIDRLFPLLFPEDDDTVKRAAITAPRDEATEKRAVVKREEVEA